MGSRYFAVEAERTGTVCVYEVWRNGRAASGSLTAGEQTALYEAAKSLWPFGEIPTLRVLG